MDIKSIIKNAVKDFKINISDIQLLQLEKYFLLLCEWNQKINLTAVTDPEGVAVKHFADSLSLLNYLEIPQNASVIDVGTGAGFPGVVLKIARPDIELTLLDSLNKRLLFLEALSNELGFSAQLVHSRAEDGANNAELRETYDVAVSRAVARLNVLCEYCIPYVKTGGCFAAMKGPDAGEEIKSAGFSIMTLGGRLKSVNEFLLPLGGGARTIALIEKRHATPQKYPRNSAKIKAKPL